MKNLRALLILFFILTTTWANAQFGTGEFSDIIIKNLPPMADCTNQTSEGELCWDTDDDVLYIGNGTTAEQVQGSGSSGATQLSDLTDIGSATATSGALLVGNGAGQFISMTDPILNSLTISGGGDINAGGTITASGGLNVGSSTNQSRIIFSSGDYVHGESDGRVCVKGESNGQFCFYADSASSTHSSGRVFVADGSGFNTVAMSGDATIASDGRLSMASQVGIGTTAPVRTLDISATTQAAMRLMYNGSSTTFSDIAVNSTGDLLLAPNGTGAISGNIIFGGPTAPSGGVILQANGDTDTTMQWSSDRITTVIGGGQFVDCRNTTQDYCTYNGSNNDVDYKWTNDSGVTTLWLDGAVNGSPVVGIGTTVPGVGGLDINAASGGQLQLTYNDADGSAAVKTVLGVTSEGALSVSSWTATAGRILISDGVNYNSVVAGNAGFRSAAGANTACTTTCGSASVCVIGSDLVTGFVACSSALADSCLCLP